MVTNETASNMNAEDTLEAERGLFRISRETIRQRHRKTIIGLVLAGALFWIVWKARAATVEPYNAMLLGLGLLTLVLFGVVHLAGYVRYVRRSRTHTLEVADDGITFTTGGQQTVLELKDVLLIERQKRLGELVSLMMRLRNRRIVRLEGYEEQERLMDLVTERFERVSAASRKKGEPEQI